MHTAIVPESRRMTFLPKHFGKAMMRVESRVYVYAEQALEDYSGGYWDFIEAEGDAGYMRPNVLKSNDKMLDPSKHRWRCTDFCNWGGELSLDAIGLLLTTLAVNHEWHRDPENDTLGEQWQKLMEVVYAHPERDSLMSALD